MAVRRQKENKCIKLWESSFKQQKPSEAMLKVYFATKTVHGCISINFSAFDVLLNIWLQFHFLTGSSYEGAKRRLAVCYIHQHTLHLLTEEI